MLLKKALQKITSKNTLPVSIKPAGSVPLKIKWINIDPNKISVANLTPSLDSTKTILYLSPRLWRALD
ncbi:MAG: hypothetical protein WKG06_16700 [Segetibacter sp.]